MLNKRERTKINRVVSRCTSGFYFWPTFDVGLCFFAINKEVILHWLSYAIMHSFD